MQTSDGDTSEIVFGQVQIGTGLKPLAQHGSIIVSGGTLTLLDTDDQQIDGAPVSECTAKPIRITMGQSVSPTLADRTCNVSIGRGARGPAVGGVKDGKALAALLQQA